MHSPSGCSNANSYCLWFVQDFVLNLNQVNLVDKHPLLYHEVIILAISQISRVHFVFSNSTGLQLILYEDRYSHFSNPQQLGIPNENTDIHTYAREIAK